MCYGNIYRLVGAAHQRNLPFTLPRDNMEVKTPKSMPNLQDSEIMVCDWCGVEYKDSLSQSIIGLHKK